MEGFKEASLKFNDLCSKVLAVRSKDWPGCACGKGQIPRTMFVQVLSGGGKQTWEPVYWLYCPNCGVAQQHLVDVLIGREKMAHILLEYDIPGLGG